MNDGNRSIREELKTAIILIAVAVGMTIIMLLLIIYRRDATVTERDPRAPDAAAKIGHNITRMAKSMTPLSETYRNMAAYYRRKNDAPESGANAAPDGADK